MKWSLFNVAVRDHPKEGTSLVMNLLTKAVALVRSGLLDDPRAREAMPEGEKTVLADGGFLVPDGRDEVKAFEYWIDARRFDRRFMESDLLVSTACNLECRYCTQRGHLDHRSGTRMSLKTAAAYIDYLRQALAAGGVRKVNIKFSGGEPLLAVEVIEHVASRASELATSAGTRLELVLVTNGYALTPQVAERMARAEINWAQVTVDGPEDVHDRRRPAPGGAPSWRRIVANCRAASEHLRLNVRVNVDRHNFGYMPAFLDYIAAQEPFGKSASVYFTPTIRARQPLDDWNARVWSPQEQAAAMASLWRSAQERGVDALAYPNSFPCGAIFDTHVALSPDGTSYCCAAFAGLPRFARVLGGPPADIHVEVMEARPWRECGACTFLPICGGGCRYTAFVEAGDPLRMTCPRAFHQAALPEFLRLKWNAGKIEERSKGLDWEDTVFDDI